MDSKKKNPNRHFSGSLSKFSNLLLIFYLKNDDPITFKRPRISNEYIIKRVLHVIYRLIGHTIKVAKIYNEDDFNLYCFCLHWRTLRV